MKPEITNVTPYTVRHSLRAANWLQRLMGNGVLFDICYEDRPIVRDIPSRSDAEHVASMMNIAYIVGNLDGQTTVYLANIRELEEYERQCG